MQNKTAAQGEQEPPRFSMRTLMLVMTAVCAICAIVVKTTEPPLQNTILAFFAIQFVMLLYFWLSVHKEREHMAAILEHGIPVMVDAKWLRRVKSPWFMLVGSLTGVSVSFAPICLIWCGPVSEYGTLEWILVPLSLLTIYFVPGFYMRLAGEVLSQLAKTELPTDDNMAAEKLEKPSEK